MSINNIYMRIFLSKLMAIFHILVVAIPFGLRYIYWNVRKYDVYLMLFLLSIRAHWAFCNGECIVSYFEKKIAIPSYKLGDDIFCSPFGELFGFHKLSTSTNIFFSDYYKDFRENILVVALLYVNRDSKNFNLLIIIAIACIIASMCYNIYYREYVKNRKINGKEYISDLIVY
jgi:hypothetical protein